MSTSNDNVLPADAPELHHWLLGEWEAIRTVRMPTLDDFDFHDAVTMPHDPFVLERRKDTEGEMAFCYLQISPNAERMYGRDPTGANVRSIMSASEYRNTAPVYLTCLDNFAPHFWEKVRSFYGREPVHFLRLVLPLADQNGEPNHLFGSFIWHHDRMKRWPEQNRKFGAHDRKLEHGPNRTLPIKPHAATPLKQSGPSTPKPR